MPAQIDNKRARHKYFILETIEAGIALVGTEVKSIRDGRVSLGEGYARIKGGEVWLHNTDISEYSHAGYTQHKPKRTRKLLLRASEIRKLAGKVSERGFTLVPLALYFNDRGIAKIKLGLAKSKSHHDKRDTLKKRMAQREISRATKGRARR
jgi:SsrA-binding protein